MREATTAERATILVVDDIAANRALAREALTDAGHAVVEAASGVEALAAFERARPDVVLLDIRMPGLDGVEVCRRMRALPCGELTPVLFMTALRDLDTFDRAMLAGAFDFLTKPVSPAELVVRVQAALVLRRTSIERESLASLLRDQRDHLMRAVLLNERLMTFLVHDLKNPVAGLQLGADRIRRDPLTSEKSREVAERMHAQTVDLSRMILGLLDLSKGDEGRLEVTRVKIDPGPIVRAAIEGVALRAEARGVQLVSSIEVDEADVDANLFKRVLENLLDNALRHTPDRTAIQVSARLVDGQVEVRVADAGRGVPEAMRERIFERFVQADDGYVARSGHGLGLTFCKLVVDAHGGRMWVEDANPGAVFCTRWPRE